MNLPLLMTEGSAEVPMGVTLFFGALLAGLILTLALEEKIHAKKSVIAGVFALVCLILADFFHLLPLGKVIVGGQGIDMPVYIPPIDWNVIAIIL